MASDAVNTPPAVTAIAARGVWSPSAAAACARLSPSRS